MNTRNIILSLGAATLMLGAPAMAGTKPVAPAKGTIATAPAKAATKTNGQHHAASTTAKRKAPKA